MSIILQIITPYGRKDDSSSCVIFYVFVYFSIKCIYLNFRVITFPLLNRVELDILVVSGLVLKMFNNKTRIVV